MNSIGSIIKLPRSINKNSNSYMTYVLSIRHIQDVKGMNQAMAIIVESHIVSIMDTRVAARSSMIHTRPSRGEEDVKALYVSTGSAYPRVLTLFQSAILYRIGNGGLTRYTLCDKQVMSPFPPKEVKFEIFIQDDALESRKWYNGKGIDTLASFLNRYLV